MNEYLDPKVIMTVVVALIILAVGVFAYFTVTINVDQTPAAQQSRVFSRNDAGTYDIQISGVTIDSVQVGGTRAGPWSAYTGSTAYAGTIVTLS